MARFLGTLTSDFCSLIAALPGLDLNSLASDFSVSVVSFLVTAFVFEPEASTSPARFWLDCCGLSPLVIKQIVFWILLVGLGCLFWLQKLHERRMQHPAKASLATASHSSPTPSSPVSPAAGQPAKPTPILPPPPVLKPKPTPMLPKSTPMLPKPTPTLRPNPNGVQ